jgi:predicted metal-dependent HD superfamily phosphohydrolase
MLDIDMAGFGRQYSEVAKDSEKIFLEYEALGLPRLQMLRNRIEFLTKLLQKDRIYYTEYFHEKYETIARENINRVISFTDMEWHMLYNREGNFNLS